MGASMYKRRTLHTNMQYKYIYAYNILEAVCAKTKYIYAKEIVLSTTRAERGQHFVWLPLVGLCALLVVIMNGTHTHTQDGCCCCVLPPFRNQDCKLFSLKQATKQDYAFQSFSQAHFLLSNYIAHHQQLCCYCRQKIKPKSKIASCITFSSQPAFSPSMENRLTGKK